MPPEKYIAVAATEEEVPLIFPQGQTQMRRGGGGVGFRTMRERERVKDTLCNDACEMHLTAQKSGTVGESPQKSRTLA